MVCGDVFRNMSKPLTCVLFLMVLMHKRVLLFCGVVAPYACVSKEEKVWYANMSPFLYPEDSQLYICNTWLQIGPRDTNILFLRQLWHVLNHGWGVNLNMYVSKMRRRAILSHATMYDTSTLLVTKVHVTTVTHPTGAEIDTNLALPHHHRSEYSFETPLCNMTVLHPRLARPR